MDNKVISLGEKRNERNQQQTKEALREKFKEHFTLLTSHILVSRFERFIAFDVLLDHLMAQKIANEDALAEAISEAGIELMFVANRPIARTLGAKTRYLSSDMMDKIEAIDTVIQEQVKKDDTLSGHSITILLHRR